MVPRKLSSWPIGPPVVPWAALCPCDPGSVVQIMGQSKTEPSVVKIGTMFVSVESAWRLAVMVSSTGLPPTISVAFAAEMGLRAGPLAAVITLVFKTVGRIWKWSHQTLLTYKLYKLIPILTMACPFAFMIPLGKSFYYWNGYRSWLWLFICQEIRPRLIVHHYDQSMFMSRYCKSSISENRTSCRDQCGSLRKLRTTGHESQ